MKLLKKVSLIHSLIALNLVMAFFSVWSFSKPSKAWQVSKSSESRFIASEESAPEQESFEEMTTLDSPCESQQIPTAARYIRLKLNSCEQNNVTRWKVTNTRTGNTAHILKSELITSTDFIYLENGENKLSIESVDEKNNIKKFEVAFLVGQN